MWSRHVNSLFARSLQPERLLGAYEQLLSRTVPGSNILALSHAACYLLNKSFSNRSLKDALVICMTRHPQLRSYISCGDGKVPHWVLSHLDRHELVASVVHSTQVNTTEDFAFAWQTAFHTALNRASFPSLGPLWRVDHVQLNNEKCALIVCSNHAIGDQKSFNTIVSELLANINGVLDDRTTMEVHAFPPSVEQAVAPGLPGFRTALWAAVQIWNTLRRPTLVPRHMPKDSGIEPRAISYEKLIDPDQRRTFTRQFQLTAAETAGLLSAVKRQQQQKQQLSPQAAVNHRPNSNLGRLTVTDALSAAMLAVSNVMLQEDVPGFVSAASSSDASLAGINSNINRIQSKMMRFLLAVGLRGYGKSKEDFTGGTVSSASGAVDYVTSSTPDLSRSSMPWAATSPTLPPQLSEEFRRCFWELAAQCRERSEDLLQKWQLVPESVRLFHIGMRLQEAGYADILRAVEIDAHNPRTLGRGYTCGVSNMGVVDFTVVGKGELTTDAQAVAVEEAYFATSHARNGVLFQLSCMTVKDMVGDGSGTSGRLCGCLQFTDPITSAEEADYFVEKLLFILKNI